LTLLPILKYNFLDLPFTAEAQRTRREPKFKISSEKSFLCDLCASAVNAYRNLLFNPFTQSGNLPHEKHNR
jgi:hypothetical protein